MVKIRGGVPGGWHGGLLPGASAPFCFQFDANGEAEVEREIAEYITSVPGPFQIVADEAEKDMPPSTPQAEQADENAEGDALGSGADAQGEAEPSEGEASETEASEKPKRGGRRKRALDD